LPRHPDVHEPQTAEQGQPDVVVGATAGEPEPDEVRDQLNAHARYYGRWVEAVAALAYSTTMSHAEREPYQYRPQAVDGLRTRLDPQRIGHFPRTLIERLLTADHLEMWSILAREYDWGLPLLWLVQSSTSPLAASCRCLVAHILREGAAILSLEVRDWGDEAEFGGGGERPHITMGSCA
jgi:hypothetical protein